MMTVNEVSKLTGVSIRTLHYYDEIGLLVPSDKMASGYRLYDDMALEKLHQILLFKELEFPLKEIKKILERPDFDKKEALKEQITLLELKKQHLEDLILHARKLINVGGYEMDFSVFDTSKIEEYTKKAKENWGDTTAYKEFEEKNKGKQAEEMAKMGQDMMMIFKEIGGLMALSPEDEKVQQAVEKLRMFITEHYYNCTIEIFRSLGEMYGAGGSMTDNIDAAGGKGTAAFTHKAIEIYCAK